MNAVNDVVARACPLWKHAHIRNGDRAYRDAILNALAELVYHVATRRVSGGVINLCHLNALVLLRERLWNDEGVERVACQWLHWLLHVSLSLCSLVCVTCVVYTSWGWCVEVRPRGDDVVCGVNQAVGAQAAKVLFSACTAQSNYMRYGSC